MATIYGQKTPPPLLKRRKSQPFGRLKPPTTKDNLGLKIGGIGPQTATALVATMGDPNAYDSGRNFAASLGLVPRQNSSANKERLGPITRMGDCYLRKLLVLGAQAYLRRVDKKTDRRSVWAKCLKERRHTNVAAVALAAKHARIAWAMLAHGAEYRPAGPEVVAV